MVALFGLNTANNLSFYAIPAAWTLAIAPHFYAISLFNKERAPGTSGFDFSFPRRSIAGVKDAKLSPATQDRYLRAEAANDNGFVNLPLFAAAVVAGNLARLPARALNTAAGIYLVSRAAYNLLYIYGTNNALGLARSAAWLTGVVANFYLFAKAGQRFLTL
ncbi:hypothetical protein Q5752_003787 [Cryptotrichosporon argae]